MKARTYRFYGGVQESDCRVAELHWNDGRVVQISGREEDDGRGKGLMIRIWPENGTAEYGGSNLDALTLHLEPDGRGWRLTDMSLRRNNE